MGLPEQDLPELSQPATRRQIHEVGTMTVGICQSSEFAVSVPRHPAAYAVNYSAAGGSETIVLMDRDSNVCIWEGATFDDEIRLRREVTTRFQNQALLKRPKYSIATVEVNYRMVDPCRGKTGLINWDVTRDLRGREKRRAAKEIASLEQNLGLIFSLDNYKHLAQMLTDFNPGLVLRAGNEATRGIRIT